MYRCRHFDLHELIPPKVFKLRGRTGWELLDTRILVTIDNLRDLYGPITINNYYFKHGGDREWSGLRTQDSPYYSPFSQHTFGRAMDCVFHNCSADSVRKAILKDINNPMFQYINALELDTNWLHVDVRNCNRIKAFKP
jgi:hypothetical protein